MIPVWLWTASAFIGLGISLWALYDAWADYRITEHARLDGTVRFASRSDMYQEAITVAAMAVASVLGIVSALPVTYLRGFIVDGLVLFIVLITLNSLYRRHIRRELMRRVGLRKPKDRCW